MNNSQLAHVWAQQVKTSGNGSNLRFDGPSIYSYSTEIARFVEGKVIYSSYGCSVTTQRHLSEVRQAINHLESYSTKENLRDFFRKHSNFSEMINAIILERIENLENDIQIFAKSRSRIGSQLILIQDNAKEILKTILDYRIRNIGKTKLENLNALSDNVQQNLTNIYKIDVATKLEKESKQSARKLELERIKQEKLVLQQKENIEKWRNGESVGSLYYLPIMLRLNGEEIETSHGARVPLNDAKELYKLLKQPNTKITRYRIGEFQVQEVTQDTLIIGCHKIPMKEVFTFAQTLNW